MTTERRGALHQESAEMSAFMGEMRASIELRGEALDELKEEFREVKKELAETNKKVDGLLVKITKWEAKLGAFMFVAACLWGFFIAMKEQILTFIKG